MEKGFSATGIRMAVPLIVMLTDFGLSDPFAGIMKGVIATIAPDARIVDLTHDIPPGEIRRGAVTLWQSRAYFPPGTVFLGVVDPGVGTSRRPILVESREQRFVGPDNGLFSYILADEYRVWELRNPQFTLPRAGATFHGRDVFAPVAAHAAKGIPGQAFGLPVKDLTQLPPPHLKSPASKDLEGEVLFADRFGNILTSLGQFEQAADGSYQLQAWINNVGIRAVLDKSDLCFKPEATQLSLSDGTSLIWVRTFAEAPEDGCAILVGSSGLIEIVANQRSAVQILGLRPGDKVMLRSQGDH